LESNFVIIATGNEITAGEVVNSNASYLAKEISALTGEVISHIAVRDGVQDIISAIELAMTQADHVLVTGGLGPTTDDLTRNAVAKVANKKLLLSEDAWTDITNLFTSMGRTVGEGHKAQCHFPEGSERFRNKAGTADGFVVKAKSNKYIWVLPGPPRELQSVWNNGMKASLQKSFPTTSVQLLTWTFLGRGESEIADYAEEVFKNLPVQLGYRAKVPFVIFKVWVKQEKISELKDAIAKLEAQFSKDLLSRGVWDPTPGILKLLESSKLKPVEFIDFSSTGVFAKRVLDLLTTPSGESKTLPPSDSWNVIKSSASINQKQTSKLVDLVQAMPEKVRVLNHSPQAQELLNEVKAVLGTLNKSANGSKIIAMFTVGDEDALIYNSTFNDGGFYFLRIKALWNRKNTDDRLMSYFVEMTLRDLNQ
jgi:nicotinamide-nucleotide amidase